MESFKKVIKTIFDGIGTVVPILSFLAIFITFTASIIARYIFNTSIRWSYEISVLGYIWCMFFGVGKAMEDDSHVVFSLVYDMLSPLWQFICKVVYNAFLMILLIIVFVPCCKALQNSSMVTSVLKIPYSVAFAPFIYMLAEIIVRSGINICKAYKEFKAGPVEKAEEGGAEA
ncbi:MAG: TRAP transporter small permease subunit [Lachnospiraceae bacterium]|nr:TRAP transporter small permease subunit [Lachnospiraceae bacterium]